MRKRTVAWLVLAAAAICSFAMCLIAPTFARNKNTASWQNSLYFLERSTAVRSDILTENGQTVVLGEMAAVREIEIHLTGEAGIPVGTFYAEPNDYLTVTFGEPVTSGTMQTVGVRMERTEACNSLEQTLEVTVRMRWTAGDEVLWADFLIPIAPPKTDEAGQNETSDTPPEIVNPTTPEDENSAPATQPTDPGGSEEPQTPSEPASPAEITSLISSFLPFYAQEVPVVLEISQQSNGQIVTLQCNGGAFPAMTRYTINGNSVLLYDGGEIPVQADAAVTILVDKPNMNLFAAEDTPEAEKKCTVTANIEVDGETLVQTIELGEKQQSPSSETGEVLVLTEVQTLAFPDWKQWDGCRIEFSLSRLESGRNMNMNWSTLDQGQCGILVGQNAIGNVCLSIDNSNRPPAGTYLIQLNRIYNGVHGNTKLFSEEFVFFVQYDHIITE